MKMLLQRISLFACNTLSPELGFSKPGLLSLGTTGLLGRVLLGAGDCLSCWILSSILAWTLDASSVPSSGPDNLNCLQGSQLWSTALNGTSPPDGDTFA